MKKAIILILVSFFTINLCFVGYGKSNAKIVVTPQLIGNEKAKITITWQPVPAHSLGDSNKAKVDYLTAKAKEWAEKHPDVKIVPIQTTIAINDSMAKILVQAAEGRAPDVAAIDSYIFPNFAKYAQPIDDVLQTKKLNVDDWFPFAQKVMKPAGKTIGLWYTTDVRILFYRKDLVKTPPKTWAELFSIGKELKEQGYDAFLYSAGRDENLTMNTLPYFWGLGGELVNDSGKPVFGEGKNREATINYFKFLKDTVDSGITPIRVLNYKSDPNMNADLASGKVAMFVGVSNMAAQLRSVIGVEKFNQLWDAAPIPMGKEGVRVSAAGGWVATVFTKDNRKRKLAADFILSLYGDDSGMEGWCKAGGYLPPRKSVFEKAEFFKSDLFAQKFKDELQYARVRPAAPIYPTISLEFQIAINNVLTGKATPEKAVDDAWKNVNK
ncbi:MAG: extracellular solute-binding protein [Bacteroidota bacterium]